MRIRVSVVAPTYDECGCTFVIPEITFDGKNWESAAGEVPAAMSEAFEAFERPKIVKNLKANIGQRLKNKYKSSQEELLEFCYDSYTANFLSKEQMTEIVRREMLKFLKIEEK